MGRTFKRTQRLILALCFALSGHASADPQISPEQAFDLFARAALEGDADANAALHRTMLDINHYEAESVPDLHQRAPELIREVVDGLIRYKIFSARSANEYGTLMTDAYARSQCRATGTRAVFPHEPADRATEIVVQFSCQVPAWNTGSGELTDAVILRKLRKSTKYAFRTWMAMLKRGEQRTLTGEAILTGHHESGYFPDAYNVRSLIPVLYSVLPVERLDPFAEVEWDPE